MARPETWASNGIRTPAGFGGGRRGGTTAGERPCSSSSERRFSEMFDYTLRIPNDGPSDAEVITLTDPLPERVRFVGEGTDGRCTYDESTRTVNCALARW